jgi:hypothetical protein
VTAALVVPVDSSVDRASIAQPASDVAAMCSATHAAIVRIIFRFPFTDSITRLRDGLARVSTGARAFARRLATHSNFRACSFSAYALATF